MTCLAATPLAACADDASSGTSAKNPQTAFDAAQAAWEESGPDAYSLHLVSSCGERAGLGEFAITVDADGATAKPLDKWSDQPRIASVPDLFDEIKAGLDGNAESVQVEYHPTLGYPQRIDIDYVRKAIDDEVCYRVSDFTSG
ncbi:MAG: DUF6174 domain-containing protein [Actinomycetes bacterium]